MLSHQVNFYRWHASDLEPEGYRPTAVSYQSSVIELVRTSCKRLTSPSFLQVGRLSPGFMEFVAEAKGKLITLEPDTKEGNSLIEFLQECPREFDVIFIWDHLLYNESTNTSGMLKLLESCSKMGTSLVMLASTRQSIPARPSKFVISPNSSVEIIPTTTFSKTAEFFDTCKQLPHWRCMRATQLRNGFREYLLVKRD